jgi:hypothetical protein
VNFSAAQLLNLIRIIGRHGCSYSIRSLIQMLEIEPDKGLLEQIDSLVLILADHGISIIPALPEGDLEMDRGLVFSKDLDIGGRSEIEFLIAEQEGEQLEFKSTFFVDLKKYRSNPKLPVKEYKSSDVSHSAIKTIAAFLNTKGGTLLIGVEDNGNPIGLSNDHILPECCNEDKWQLAVRSVIESSFKDGKAVNSYVRVLFCEIGENVRIAAIKVSPRKATAFTKNPAGGHDLYTRNGNRTDKLDITQAEDFFLAKQTT